MNSRSVFHSSVVEVANVKALTNSLREILFLASWSIT